MRRLLAPLLFGLVTLLALYKVVFHADFTLLRGGDMAAAYFPWFDVCAHWLRKGVFMLWDPYVYAGKLTMGEPQPGLFYPLNWLVMLIPAAGDGVSADALQGLLVLDFFLAGLFFYFLARSFDQSAPAAALAGIAFAFGGYTPQVYGYVNVFSGFVWMPLALLFFRKALLADSGRSFLKFLLGAGAALALSFLPGHHIPPIHTGLLMLLFAAWVTIREWKSVGWRMRLRPALALAGAAGSSLVWTAFQWIPSAGWARLVFRWVGSGEPVKWGEKVPYSVLQDSSYVSPQDAFSLVLPYVSTNATIYVGGVLLFLGLVGLLFGRKRDSGFFGAFAIVYFLLSWGRFSALHGWLNTFVPGVWFAREIFYYLIPFQACLALLAGWGLDALVEARQGASQPARLTVFVKRAGWSMVSLVLASGAAGAYWILGHNLPINHPFVTGASSLALYLLILCLLLFMLHTGRMNPSAFRMVVVFFVLTDLISHFAADIKPKRVPEGQENTYVREFWKRPRTAEYLRELRAIEVFRVDDPLNIFPPNYGDAWRIEATMGHGATGLVDYFMFRGSGWGAGSNATALLNARYFPSRLPVPWAEKALEDPVTLYRNPRALPRAFIAERYRTFARKEEMWSWIGSPLFSPGETVLLAESDLLALDPGIRSALVREDEPAEIRLTHRRTAAERLAEAAQDPMVRHQLSIMGAPWGWSAGDEATVELAPRQDGRPWNLVLGYYAGGSAPTIIPVRLEEGVQARELAVALPLSEENSSGLKREVLSLGMLPARAHRISIRIPEGAGAKVDSIRLVTGSEPPATGMGEVLVQSLKPNRLKFDARLTRPGFVVVSEVFYAGWKAFVDGKATPLLRANTILRAVPVGEGIHQVELRFRPESFFWGLGFASTGILAGLLLWWKL